MWVRIFQIWVILNIVQGPIADKDHPYCSVSQRLSVPVRAFILHPRSIPTFARSSESFQCCLEGSMRQSSSAFAPAISRSKREMSMPGPDADRSCKLNAACATWDGICLHPSSTSGKSHLRPLQQAQITINLEPSTRSSRAHTSRRLQLDERLHWTGATSSCRCPACQPAAVAQRVSAGAKHHQWPPAAAMHRCRRPHPTAASAASAQPDQLVC